MKISILLLLLSTDLIARDLPTPTCIEPNVKFWKQILTSYNENDLILHNERTFEIYKVVKLDPLNKIERKKTYTQSIKDLEDVLNSEDLDNLRAQIGISSRFNQGLIRSKKYLPYIRKIFKQEGIPDDIVFLPHVESSFNPKAGSRVGAKGLWQIMPSTARMYGTKNTSKLYDPQYATRLAAKILKDNYQTLGSWDLAINAYNSGIGNLSRAIQATSSRDICVILEKYEGRTFKFASRNYLSQFYAALDIVEEHEGKEETLVGQEQEETEEKEAINTVVEKVKKQHKNKIKHKVKHKKHKHKHKK